MELNLSTRQKTGLAIAAVLLVIGVTLISQLTYTLDAHNVAVFQAPVTGTLSVKTEPGTYMRFFSGVTEYPRRLQYSFSAKADQGGKADESLPVRFNDGGHAKVSGVISWEIAMTESMLIRLHKEFGSITSIEQQLVRPAVERAMYLTSPLMSSTESYASRRNDFLLMFADQVQNGIYKTETISKKVPDPITGAEKTVNIVQLVMDAQGVVIRQGGSPLAEFGIKVLPPTIDEIKYDEDVEKQIKNQRDAAMAVQTAKAQALEAEQRALTVVKNGEADAAKSKWEQEVIKAREVTQAEQQKQVAELAAQRDKNVAETAAQRDLDVATLHAKAAEQTKAEQILLGQGESERKRLVMAADGALAQKLGAYVEVNKAYAEAIAKHVGSWVPSVVMGGSGNGQAAAAGSGAQALIDLFTVSAAKSLGLDMNVPANSAVGAKQ